MNTLALISLFCALAIIVNGQACGNWGGCSAGACCSKWGYCGTTGDHCGTGCQSGSCWGAPKPPPPPPSAPSGGSQRCGANWAAANSGCGAGCSTNANCPAGQSCFKDLKACGSNPPPPPSNPPPSNPPPSSSSTTRCGSNWEAANNGCGASCSNNNNCPAGQSCFKDLKACGGSNPPPSQPPSGPIPTGSGSITSMINKNDFNRALSACGVNKPNLYDELVRAWTAPLPGGLKELALLMGNMAHESGAFNYVEEIRCAGVNFVTAECPYGLYHGRGYIQLSWDYNYREAAAYLNNPRIFSDPNIVMNDPTVNWQTVQWFWVSRVQDTFRRRGYTMGASVRAINGGLECDSGPISPQRVQFIQCFERNYGTEVDFSTSCPARAVGDQQSVFSENQTQQQQLPTEFVTALVVLGVITLVLGIIVVAILIVLGKRMRSQEHV